MLTSVPFTQDLVLVGGGHAHALVLREWGMTPLPGARVTLINPGPTAPYTGMLPGHIAGHYSRDRLEIDLLRLAHFAQARVILAPATGIDRAAQVIHVEGRGPVAYDVASIDVGITARMDIAGFAEHAVGAKPLDTYAQAWRDFLAAVAQGEKPPQVAVIGGGVAGCELAMAMAFALRSNGATPKVTVIEAGPDITGVGARARAKLRHAMTGLGITVVTGAQVEQITAEQVVLADQPPIPVALCVGAAGAFPHPWIAQTDLPLEAGFIIVDKDLRVRGDPNLFAVGDCAHMPFAPRPKAGVFAVRAAPVLHHNVRAVLSGGACRPFHPQKSYLKLISLGGKSAMAEKYGWTVAGPALWRWKDRIDGAFMNRLDTLPQMPRPTLPKDVALGVREAVTAGPLCGGCGAKVGAGALREGLGAGPRERAGDVVQGPGDDAAILRQPGGGFQVISTDHLRAFTNDPIELTRISAIHALGDIWAMGAAPQAAVSTIILPQMSPRLQTRTLREITETAQTVFGDAGANVVGGHTSLGAEMTIGFTVTGTRQDPPITVAGAQAGDVLVLTRPIGSGVILAAQMAGAAPARVVADALAVMGQSQQAAAAVLSGAKAMTDVTGFGLAGHVQDICAASHVRAEIWSAQVPVYRGARSLAEAGHRSVLVGENRAYAPTTGVNDALLHDPQTAGGLLAAMPRDAAERAIKAMQNQRYSGFIIGELFEGTGPIHVL